MFSQPPSLPLPLRPVLSRHDIFRSHLTDIRHGYQTLLGSMTWAEWQTPAKTSKWTVGEMMVHLYLRLASIPAAINGIRMGKGYMNMPFFMREYIQFWHVKTNAGKWTPRSLSSAYEDAYGRAVEALEVVGEEEWWLGAEVWGEGETTIIGLFESQPDYFASHLYEVRVALGR
jgi:hypothetical protein